MSLASRKLIQATAGAAGAADTGDDDFANVVLLLDGDGTSGDDNNTFTDSSTNGFTVTETGSVVQGSFSPYGDNWSNYFDGSGDYIKTTTNIDDIATSEDFNIEAWIYVTDTSVIRGIFQSGEVNDTLGIRITTAERLQLVQTNGGTLEESASGAIKLNQWHHIAVSRSSGTRRLFLDGAIVDSTTSSTASFPCDKAVVGGRWLSGSLGQPFSGYISNVRFVVGSAIYTSAFTPPTEPLTAVTNTELLTSQSNRFLDNSTNDFDFTVGGDTKVTPFSPFKDDDARDITTDGGSAYFDGSSYLSTPNDTAYRPNTGAYTVEGWFYTTKSTTQILFDARQTGNTDQRVTFWVTNGDDLNYWHGVGTSTSSNVFNTGEWVYIAASRGSGTTEIYVNGTRTKSFSDSTQLYNFRPYYGARWDAGAKLDEGYLADWRITVGEKLYTGTTMTVPTAPIGLHSSTDSYLAFQDAGIYDRSGINNLNTVGNAQIDTAVTKYGTGSMEFDGTGDSIDIEHKDELNLGTGDSTIEFWVSLSSGTPDNGGIIAKGNGSANTGWQLIWNNTNEILFIRRGGSAGSPQLQSGNNTVFRDNTWHHVAVTTSGTTVRMFLNGTQVDSYTDTSSWDSNEVLRLGTNRNNANFIEGYLDDVRITNGVARYTSSFTPPTAELPKF